MLKALVNRRGWLLLSNSITFTPKIKYKRAIQKNARCSLGYIIHAITLKSHAFKTIFLQIAKSKQNYDGRHNYFVNLRHFELQFLSSRLATLSVSNFKQAEMSVMTFTRFRKLAEDARSHFFKKNVFNRNFFIWQNFDNPSWTRSILTTVATNQTLMTPSLAPTVFGSKA